MKRLLRLIKAWFNRFLGKAEAASPRALVEQAKEDLRQNIAKLNSEAAVIAGQLSQLEEQDKKDDKEAASLKAKAQQCVKAGNEEAAKKFALRYKQNRERNVEVEQQIEEIREQYQQLIDASHKATADANDKIRSIEASLDSAERHEALASVKEMASSAVSSIGGAGDSLNRLEESVSKRKAEAIGRSRVADSMKGQTVGGDDLEIDEDIEDDMALEELLAGGTDVIQQVQLIEAKEKVKA